MSISLRYVFSEIQCFKQLKWMKRMEPSHWQALSKGFSWVLSAIQQNLHCLLAFSPSL